MGNKIKTIIVDSLTHNKVLSKKELVLRIGQEIQAPSESLISWHLYQLKKQGKIHSSGYSRYSLSRKSEFTPSRSEFLGTVYQKIKTGFPYIRFCIWDSRWFNEFMLHQLLRYYIVIEVDKDAAEPVFNLLTGIGPMVFLDPDAEMYYRYISNYQEVIIVKSLVSESPLAEKGGIVYAGLEKLLVDCLAEKELFAAQQTELDFIFQSAFEKYHVNVNKMLRYARRRNQQHKIMKYLHGITAL